VIFVVDGDPSIREALHRLTASAGWRAKLMSCAEEFLAEPRRMAPSCVIAEMDLPGLSGADLQRYLVDRAETPLILMSERMDVHTAVRLMRHGAFEALTKPFAAETLLTAIGQAIDRSCAVLGDLAEITDLEDRYLSLTPREKEVLSLVASGHLNKQVGAALGISEITVKAHRGRMMHKMKARSFAELVTMASSLHLPDHFAFAPMSHRFALCTTRFTQSPGDHHASHARPHGHDAGRYTGVVRLARVESRGPQPRSAGSGTGTAGSHADTPSFPELHELEPIESRGGPAAVCQTAARSRAFSSATLAHLELRPNESRGGSSGTRRGAADGIAEPRERGVVQEDGECSLDHRASAQTLTSRASYAQLLPHTSGRTAHE
jgi:FixJ family two-component response regulator